MSRVRSRNWVFTYNNPTSCPIVPPDGALYLTYGIEKGELGTVHLQGFVNYKNAVVMPKTFLPKAHFEPMRGTQQQAIKYCHKDGDYVEFGVRPLTQDEKGERQKRRYEEARTSAKQGKLDDIPADLFIRHYRTLKTIANDYAPEPTVNSTLDHVWIYGPSGSGKSKYARDHYGDDLYIKNQNKWWDGYTGQKNVLIDDLHPSWVGMHQLKQWADHYQFRAEVKGSTIFINPERIIVTSNYHPDDCNFKEEDLQPIKRRFKIIHMYEPFKK